jgi:hypothetical protein
VILFIIGYYTQLVWGSTTFVGCIAYLQVCVIIGWCFWLLLVVVIVVGYCCWLLLLVVVVGSCCWLLVVVVVVVVGSCSCW